MQAAPGERLVGISIEAATVGIILLCQALGLTQQGRDQLSKGSGKEDAAQVVLPR